MSRYRARQAAYAVLLSAVGWGVAVGFTLRAISRAVELPARTVR